MRAAMDSWIHSPSSEIFQLQDDETYFNCKKSSIMRAAMDSWIHSPSSEIFQLQND